MKRSLLSFMLAKNQGPYRVIYTLLPIYIAIHFSGNIINENFKKEIRAVMKPCKRVKDIYE